VEREIAGARPFQAGGKACVFVHFDPEGKVDPYVHLYVAALAELGFAIVFVTCGGTWDEEEMETLRPLVARIVRRKNIGYDFFGYKLGLRRLAPLDRYESILLVNDSVYGPLTDLEPILAEMKARGTEFWGVSDSYDRHWHVQSYFLHFSGRVLSDGIAERFFEKYRYRLDKKQVIAKGELKLSWVIGRKGYRIGSYVPYFDLFQDAREAGYFADTSEKQSFHMTKSPVHYYWPILFEKYRFPFIKRELILRGEGGKSYSSHGWRAAVAKISSYDLDIIDRHIERWRRLVK
jgi:lipopolysaccharide biosynthesis protein